MRRVVSSTCMAAMLTFGIAVYAQTTGQNPTGQAGAPTMTSDRQSSGDRVQTQQQMTLVGCVQREADYRQAAGSSKGGAMGTGMGVGNEFVLVNASASSGSQTSMSGSAGTSTAATSPTSTTPTASGTAGAAGTTGTAPTGTPTGTVPTATAPTSTAPTGTATAGATAGTTSGTVSGTASGTVASPPSASSPSASPSSSASTTSGTAYALTGNREKELEQYVGQRVEIVGTIERGAARSGSGYGGARAATGTTPSGTASGTSTGTTASGAGTVSGSAGAARFGDLQQINIVSFRAVGGSCSQ